MDIVPVYVGLDYHSQSFRVCVLTEDGVELWNRSVPSGTLPMNRSCQRAVHPAI